MSSPFLYAGVDPGYTGALAFYDAFEDELILFDTPCYQIKGRNVIDMYQLADIIRPRAQAVRLCVIEEVHSMPKQGVASTFAFGKAAGAVQAAMAALKVPTELLRPRAWKQAMNCPVDKDAARQRASRLLPGHTTNWTLKKHDGRAEAALMALLAYRLVCKREGEQ